MNHLTSAQSFFIKIALLLAILFLSIQYSRGVEEKKVNEKVNGEVIEKNKFEETQQD